jgi:hypothetical protein
MLSMLGLGVYVAVKVRVQDKGCVGTDWEHYCHRDGKRARWLHLTGAIEKG